VLGFYKTQNKQFGALPSDERRQEKKKMQCFLDYSPTRKCFVVMVLIMGWQYVPRTS